MGNDNKNTIYVAANGMNIYAVFQLHPPYGFWEEDFWLWQPIKISDLDKIHTVGRGLLQKNFCKLFFFFKISAVTQK